MSGQDFQKFEEKMRDAGVMVPAIRSFERNYRALRRGESGQIGEGEIEAVAELPVLEEGGGEFDPDLLAATVMIKLNGGLGTSMGLQKVKSLLEVRPGVTFLDLIVRQVVSLREATGAGVRLLFMNSFATSKDTLEHLAANAPASLARADEVEMVQNQVPKINASTYAPVDWPPNPALEWCPPGHGDLYPALMGSGWLDRLLGMGIRYAFVSNSDNLGAVLSPVLLERFATGGAPFLMEVTRRTEADRKGGHLARRAADGRLLLREIAQCPADDLAAFQDIERNRYFNTNSIWLRLDQLKEMLDAEGGVMPLPMICNRKTVDPRDRDSTPVIQLETAMGAAIECFEGAQAIEVSRSRFAPVKKTSDLLALRSDAYLVGADGCVTLAPERAGSPPVVELDSCHQFVDALDRLGVPSLIDCEALTVRGEVEFCDGVVIRGRAEFDGGGGKLSVPAGVYPE